MEYITDKIGEEYKDWEEGDYIYIKAPTGTGKTHFVFNTLAEYANKTDDKILYLCNRTALKDEVKDNEHSALISENRLTPKQVEQVELGVKDLYNFRQRHMNVYIMTYQKLELIIKEQYRTDGDIISYEIDEDGNIKQDEYGSPIVLSRKEIKERERDGETVITKQDEYGARERTDYFKNAYEKLFQYKYIVFDEIQYFLEDSTFNSDTHLSFDFMWQKTPQCKILMSATGGFTKKYGDMLMNETDGAAINFKYPEDHYYIPKNSSYIDIVFFKDNKPQGKDYPVDCIKKILSETEKDKVIYFVERTNRMETLIKIPEINDNAHYVLSANNDKLHLQEINELHTYLKQGNSGSITFDKRVLVTTSALCNGVTLKDRNIKHIICDISNIYTAIQCIGRKRPLDEEDKVTVYIPIQNYSFLNALKYRRKIDLATKYQNQAITDRREFMANPDFQHIKDDFYTDYINIEGVNNPVLRLNWAKIMYYESQSDIYGKWKQQIDTGIDNDNSYINMFLDIAEMQDCKTSIEDISEETISDKVPKDELLALIDKYEFDNFGEINSESDKEIRAQWKQWGITRKEFEYELDKIGYIYKAQRKNAKRYHTLIRNW